MQRRAGGRPKKRNQNLEDQKEVNWKFRHTGHLMFQRSSGPRLCIASRLFQPRKSTESSSPSLPRRGVEASSLRVPLVRRGRAARRNRALCLDSCKCG